MRDIRSNAPASTVTAHRHNGHRLSRPLVAFGRDRRAGPIGALELVQAKLVVERVDVLCDHACELLRGVVDLAAQHFDPVELVARGLALPAHQPT